MRIIDLTQTLSADSLSYPGHRPGIGIRQVDAGDPEMQLSSMDLLDPHCGTHIDAPLHFQPGGHDVVAMPLEALSARVIAIKGSAIEVSHLPSIELHGMAVVFSTGWEAHAGTPAYFAGYPALTAKAAEALVKAGVRLVGIDTPSVDPAKSHPKYPAHRILLHAGIPILEGLCNLPALLREHGTILLAAFPLKIRGLEGSPVRAVALIPDETNDADAGRLGP